MDTQSQWLRIKTEELANFLVSRGLIRVNSSKEQAYYEHPEYPNRHATLPRTEDIMVRSATRILRYVGCTGEEIESFIQACTDPKEPRDAVDDRPATRI